ncbi:hypothetical protein BGZ96_006829, partial [Linnemannia gamsii]
MTILAVKEMDILHNNSNTSLTSNPKISKSLSGFFSSIFNPSPKNKEPQWTNWAKNQSCDPSEIFHPKTLQDLTAIVLKAKASGKKIRCAGSSYTWSSSSVTDG